MEGCKTSEGMCNHEKMIAVVMIAVIIVVAAKLLHLF
jgi:cell division protein FtsL